MSDKKINLEEIIEPYKKYLVEGIDGHENISGDGMFVGDVLDAMKEACKQSLELAAENAENNVKGKYVDWINWFSKDELSFSSDDGETVIVKINKQSILNTINQIE